MTNKFWLRCGLVVCGVLLAGAAQADFPTVPKETYEALKLDRSADPKQLYEALLKRYLDPAQGAGKGMYGQYWEPVSFSRYFDPNTFYKPPKSVKEIATREQCVKCHTDESPGWVAAWKRSTHANLDKIRKLTPKDDTYYKKAKLEEIETNLRSIGKLGKGEQLKEVGCIDCHFDINTKNKADHRKDIKLATADTCGTRRPGGKWWQGKQVAGRCRWNRTSSCRLKPPPPRPKSAPALCGPGSTGSWRNT